MPAKAKEPKIGTFFLVAGKLLIDSTALSKAGQYGDFSIHEGDHITFWSRLVEEGKVPNTEYERFPRGRVAFNTKTEQFTLLADKCILQKKAVVKAILKRLNLPARRTKTGSDLHYRCFRCLGRNV